MRSRILAAIPTVILATRPKTLTAAIVPVAVGTALARALGALSHPWLSVDALISALFIQIGTNLVNDAIDFKKGADTETRTGPLRATQSGLLSPGQVMAGAFLCFFLATLFGIPLVIHAGWPLVAIGIASILLAYGYTGGPFPLAYLGLGDLFVLLFFGWVAVGGVVLLHRGQIGMGSIVAGTQIGLLSTVLIAINNLRDREQDEKVGKNTLAVRLGVRGTRFEIVFLVFAPFFLNFYWLFGGFQVGVRLGALLSFLALPLAIELVRRILVTEPSSAYNRFLGMAAGLHLSFGLLWSAGCLK